MRPVFVSGVGLWSTGFSDVEGWRQRCPDPRVVEPVCAVLPPRLARFTSLSTRMAADAVAQASNDAGVDLARCHCVLGSASGEIQIAIGELDVIVRGNSPSPARFKNSVHNAAAAHISIACGNLGFSTSLAAGESTFAMSVLEAFALLDERGGAAVVAVADEPLPAPLDVFGVYDPLAVAFLLSSEPSIGARVVRLHPPKLERNRAPMVAHVPERLARNPAAAALPLLDAVLSRSDRSVLVDLGGEGWVARVEPPVERRDPEVA